LKAFELPRGWHAAPVAYLRKAIVHPNNLPTLGNIKSRAVAATISPAWRNLDCLNMAFAFVVVMPGASPAKPEPAAAKGVMTIELTLEAPLHVA